MIGMTSRRGFLRVAGAAVAACAARAPRPAMPPSAYKAVAFDGFALFDPTPIASLATRLFAVKGAQLAELWRVKQFDYQWLRAVSGRYQDFWTCTGSALAFAARAVGMTSFPRSTSSGMRDSAWRRWRT
jgi:2-haloacid dehalogenase